LNYLLGKSSAVCNFGVKEKHFFNHLPKNVNLTKWYEEYNSQFIGCRPEFYGNETWGNFTLDSTPHYIDDPYAPQRIFRSYSTKSLNMKKFVAILREPVSRDYSEYQRTLRICFRLIDDYEFFFRGGDYSRHSGPQDRYINTIVKCEWIMNPRFYKDWRKDGYNITLFDKNQALSYSQWSNNKIGMSERDRGLYYYQIKRWLKFIKREQLFIINFQTLIVNTTDTIQRLSQFLGIEGSEFLNKNNKTELPPPPTNNKYSDWPGSYLDCEVYEKKYKYYSKRNEGLIEFINDAKKKPKLEPRMPNFDFAHSYNNCVSYNPNYIKNILFT